jgi:hypothetical protein
MVSFCNICRPKIGGDSFRPIAILPVSIAQIAPHFMDLRRAGSNRINRFAAQTNGFL